MYNKIKQLSATGDAETSRGGRWALSRDFGRSWGTWNEIKLGSTAEEIQEEGYYDVQVMPHPGRGGGERGEHLLTP